MRVASELDTAADIPTIAGVSAVAPPETGESDLARHHDFREFRALRQDLPDADLEELRYFQQYMEPRSQTGRGGARCQTQPGSRRHQQRLRQRIQAGDHSHGYHTNDRPPHFSGPTHQRGGSGSSSWHCRHPHGRRHDSYRWIRLGFRGTV